MSVDSMRLKFACIASVALFVGGLCNVSHAQHRGMDHSDHADHHEMDHSGHAAHIENIAKTADRGVEEADVKLSDAELINQSGDRIKLESELLNGEIVVVDFIFTTCTTICPVTTALLAASKRDFEGLAGVKYVSISIDPNNDTPTRLDAFSKKHKADWAFVTGRKATVDKVLLDMDAYSTNPEDHAPMILVGDASTGEFVRMFGLPNGEEIDAHVKRLQLAREHAHHGGHHGHH